MAVVAMPYASQLDGGEDRLQRRLAALGERAGWLTIDPLADFRAAHAEDAGLFLDVWHPTARGHALTAERIFGALTDAGWLPDAGG